MYKLKIINDKVITYQIFTSERSARKMMGDILQKTKNNPSIVGDAMPGYKFLECRERNKIVIFLYKKR